VSNNLWIETVIFQAHVDVESTLQGAHDVPRTRIRAGKPQSAVLHQGSTSAPGLPQCANRGLEDVAGAAEMVS